MTTFGVKDNQSHYDLQKGCQCQKNDKDLGHHGLGVPGNLGVDQHYLQLLLREKAINHDLDYIQDTFGEGMTSI